MDRYNYLDLDLECDGGGGGGGGGSGGSVSEKAALFGGMFKRTSKSKEPSVEAQDSLSVNGELSNSNDSLNENNYSKEKGGVFKGMFKKTAKSSRDDEPQETISLQNPELSTSSNSLTDKPSKHKSGVLGGKQSRPGHVRRPSQELLELSASNDSLNDKTNTSKESGGMLSGIFKKSPKPKRASAPSEEDLPAQSELSGSTDSLSNTKDSGGMLSGMFKKSPKPKRASAPSEEDLPAQSELSESTDNLSNTKGSGGMLSGMFKKATKPFGARAKSQEDLSAANELSGSSENLSEVQAKEKGGILSGMFRKKGAKSQSQDDLSVDDEVSASNDSLTEKPSENGAAANILRNPFTSSSEETKKTAKSGDSNDNSPAAHKQKAKQNGFSAMMKSTFYIKTEEKSYSSDDEKTSLNGDNQPSHKQSKLAGAMTKLNPFRAENKPEKQTGSDDEDSTVSREKLSSSKPRDTENTEATEEKGKQKEEKSEQVKSNMIQPERKARSETPPVPPRPTEEEIKGASTNEVKARRAEEKKDTSPRKKKGKPSETPGIPAKPSEEDMNKRVGRQQKHNNNPESQSDDERAKEGESERKSGDENLPDNKVTKVKKQKRNNPFMPRVGVLVSSDDEGLKDGEDSSPKEENKEKGTNESEETKVEKKPKRHNPFMPRFKAKVVWNHEQDGAGSNTAENEGANRSLFDQLEDFRTDPSQPEDSQDVEDLMDWWNNVESWEDTSQNEDMTEKEEAKAFAVTAEKVQKGIRVFNKLFSERAESLWQHVIDLNGIADALDKFNKNTKIAQITGGSTSAIGGVATIAGLALAPITMGTSLIVTAVGLGVATAGGLTSAGAGISNQVNNSMDRKKVEKIVEDYQEKMLDLNKGLKFIKQGIENLRKFDLIKMKKHAYNRDFPALTSSFYEDGAMAGKAILINANEIMRVVQIANVAGSTAARAVQIASMATGVLTGLFVGMDIYFVAKDSKELKKGAKSEFAAKIRDVATQLHDGLVELNGIREELQSTTPEDNMSEDTKTLDSGVKEKSDKHDSSDEDEIDRIKKAIKKDIENREYV